MTNWPEEYRLSFDDCFYARCVLFTEEGQCHLKAGHPGDCDPNGESHLDYRQWWDSGIDTY